jgi:hypothetical protein
MSRFAAMEPQQQQARPFGLMLLTGLSFGIAVWNLMLAGQTAFAIKMKLDPTYLPQGLDPAVVVAMHALPLWFYVFVIAMALIKAPLLLVAAWGYYGFKRLGRICATAYAVVSLAESGITLLAFPQHIGAHSLIGALFAVFTLLAVHGPFKALLVR